jgi:hypothetical protein
MSLKTIKELRQKNPEFEMYVMLGRGSTVKMRGLVLNTITTKKAKETLRKWHTAVELANEYPEIIKVIAVEMRRW